MPTMAYKGPIYTKLRKILGCVLSLWELLQPLIFCLVLMTNRDAKDCQGGNKGRDKVGRQGGEERGTVLVCYLAGSGDRTLKEMYSVPA
ncbi:hypothetical protein Tco_0252898 [Tanacetum coccineum]